MIAESHISIHTFPELNYISFDCYSCKYFETETVIEIFKEHFELQKFEVQVIRRLFPNVD